MRKTSPERLAELAESFMNPKKTCIIGDAMADISTESNPENLKDLITHFKLDRSSRINPEGSEIPIFIANGEYFPQFAGKCEYVPGGAANVAMNLRSLGGKCAFLGYFGEGMEGRKLNHLLSDSGIMAINIGDHHTTWKQRLYHNEKCFARIDHDEMIKNPDNQKDFDKMEIKDATRISDAVIISDYMKGAITPNSVKFISELNKGKQVYVDTKPKHVPYFAGMNNCSMKMNRREAAESLDLKVEDLNPEKHILDLQSKYELPEVIVTLDKDGAIAVDREGAIYKAQFIPLHANGFFDVTGRGDVHHACYALARINGASIQEALELAQTTCAIKVEKKGTVQISNRQLKEAIYLINKQPF